jgi:hypothetical protein
VLISYSQEEENNWRAWLAWFSSLVGNVEHFKKVVEGDTTGALVEHMKQDIAV